MVKFDAMAFVGFSAALWQQRMTILSASRVGEPFAILTDAFDDLRRSAEVVKARCISMGMRTSAKSIERLLNTMSEIEALLSVDERVDGSTVYRFIKFDGPSTVLFERRINDIPGRLEDELESVLFLQLDMREASFYEPSSPPFGLDVDSQFPGVADEILEAHKCYALGRSTAAAFHAIRCLEAGMAAMWRCLGIPDPISGFERNWSNRKKRIEEAIEARWPSRTGRIGKDAKLFDRAIGALTGMQNPYRNDTMHFDAKYTPEEALHIIELVKGFMQRIASRMNENGEPKVL